MVVLVLVESGIREIEIGYLKSGLKILCGGVSADSVSVAVNVGIDRKLLAGEHLHHRCGRKVGNAGVLLVESPYVRIEGVEILIGYQALAALLEDVEGNPVLLVVGGEHDDLDSVGKLDHGRTVKAFGSRLDLAALECCGIEEGFGNVLSCGPFDFR